MRPFQLLWAWPTTILLSTLAVTAITFLFPQIWVRPIAIMGFLFIIPGMTITRFFHTNDPFIEWMLAIALSFTIDAFAAGIILYTGQWSPTNILSFLSGFCLSGAVAQLAIVRPIIEPMQKNSEETVLLDKPALARDEPELVSKEA